KRIRFTPDQAPYIREREWHHTQRIEDEEDGGLVLSFKTNNLYETKRWVLSWGADAEVMEPEELKGAVRREVGAMGKIY
ncbi:MAG: WYL domain-containing protein, partial [Deltaproteobacteria bacterium]|nr:WYL domain-containing protein [Deltaproteobacteria bacterium]